MRFKSFEPLRSPTRWRRRRLMTTHLGFTSPSVYPPPSAVITFHPNAPSTGYKEFHDYLADPTPSNHPLFEAAVERMKLSTRQYAKKQISWIRNKLLPAVRQANAEKEAVSFYLLDATGRVSKTEFTQTKLTLPRSCRGRREMVK